METVGAALPGSLRPVEAVELARKDVPIIGVLGSAGANRRTGHLSRAYVQGWVFDARGVCTLLSPPQTLSTRG